MLTEYLPRPRNSQRQTVTRFDFRSVAVIRVSFISYEEVRSGPGCTEIGGFDGSLSGLDGIWSVGGDGGRCHRSGGGMELVSVLDVLFVRACRARSWFWGGDGLFLVADLALVVVPS